MRVKLYVEGGGTRPGLRAELRRAFAALFQRAGFEGRMPKVIACGPRSQAIKKFNIAMGIQSEFPMLLIDSEEPITDVNPLANPRVAWDFLNRSERVRRPPGTEDDQAQLMVACMETWIVVDRDALKRRFRHLNENMLPPLSDMESRPKEAILNALRAATAHGGGREFNKARDSFDVLSAVDPAILEQYLPFFARFISALDSRL